MSKFKKKPQLFSKQKIKKSIRIIFLKNRRLLKLKPSSFIHTRRNRRLQTFTHVLQICKKSYTSYFEPHEQADLLKLSQQEFPLYAQVINQKINIRLSVKKLLKHFHFSPEKKEYFFKEILKKYSLSTLKSQIILNNLYLPKDIKIDPSSLKNLQNAQPTHALTGVLNTKTDTIYLLPVLRKYTSEQSILWTGTSFNKPIELLGLPATQIIFPTDLRQNTAHFSLALKVKEGLNNESRINNFLGFGLNFYQDLPNLPTLPKVYFSPRSRTLNRKKNHTMVV